MNKSILLLLAFVMLPFTAMVADDDGHVTLTVEPAGSLSTLVEGVGNEKITSLTLKGHLNSKDLIYLRKFVSITELDVLDMKDIELDYDGGVYNYSGTVRDYSNDFISYKTTSVILYPINQTYEHGESNMLGGSNKTIKEYSNCLRSLFWNTLFKKLVLPDCLTEIGDGICTASDSLETVVLPQNCTKIGAGAFTGCKRLKNVLFPNKAVAIGNSAFYNCVSLQEVNFPVPPKRLSVTSFAGTPWQNSIQPNVDGFYYIGKIAIDMTAEKQPKGNSIEFSNGTTGIADDFKIDNVQNIEEVILPQSIRLIGNNVFKGSAIKQISLPSQLEILGECNFYENEKIENISLPSTLVEIDKKAFCGCTSLKGISFPSTLEIIGASAFYNCTSLTHCLLPSGIKIIGQGAFSGCISLNEVTIPENVELIGAGCFRNCTNVKKVSYLAVNAVPTDMVGNILNFSLFGKNENLEEIILGPKVQKIPAYAFAGCSRKISKLEFPNTLIYIGPNAFDGVDGFSNITIPNSVTTIGYRAFAYCDNLTSVIIPKSVNIFGENVFMGCSELKSITYLSDNPPTTGPLLDSFGGVTLYVPMGTINTYYSTPSWNYFSNIEEIEVEGEIGEKKVHVAQAGTLSIQISDEEKYQINKLTVVGSLNGTDFKLIRDMAGNNSEGKETPGKLKALDLSEARIVAGGEKYIDTDTVWSAKYFNSGNYHETIENDDEIGKNLFLECRIKNIVLPNNLKAIGKEAFRNCQSLSSLTIPDGVTSIDEKAFYNCSSLTSVMIPNSITTIGNSVFYGCKSLTSVNLPDGLETLNDYTFCNCSSLTSVTIPNSVTSINGSAFINCESLESIVLPSKLKEIGAQVFMFCANLDNIVIPKEVSYIGSYAFYGCSKLNTITCEVIKSSFNLNAFQGVGTPETPVTLTVPKKSYYEAKIDSEGKLYGGYFTIVGMPSNNIDFADASVKAICIAKWDTDGDGELSIDEAADVKDIGEAFKENNAIKSLNDLVYFTGLTSIPSNAFYYCEYLSSIVIPKNVSSIGEYHPLVGCSNLTSIKVDAENKWFDSRNDCNAIIEKNTGVLVAGCKNTVIPDGVTTIGTLAFCIIEDLATLRIPEGVKTIGIQAFYGCKGLKSIHVPSTLKDIGKEAFVNCLSLTDISVDSANPVFDSRDNCNAVIETATGTLVVGSNNTKIPAGVKHIGEAAFAAYVYMPSITIPEGIVSIGENAFWYCHGLTSVTLPSTIREIEEYAFEDCANLTAVYSNIEEPFVINENVFTTYNTTKLYVPYLTKDKYKGLASWNHFSNIIEMAGGDVITITANSYEREYGTVNPDFKYTVSGGKADGTAVVTCEATAKSTVGTYKIIIRKGDVANSDVTLVNGALTIKPAKLTIKAGDYTKYQGNENPEFTLNYEGFKNGETEAVLTKKPIVTTTADWNSPVGIYDVFISGAEAQNYEINYVAGTLTIEKRPKGDLDAKGYTDVTDVVAAINHVLGERTLNYDEKELLDMNNDGELNVGDIILLVKAILEQGNHFEIPTLARGDAETIDLTQYTAMQLTVNVPSGARIKDIRLTGDNNSSHNLMYQQTDDEHYTVVVYSMSNQTFKPVSGCLLEVITDGDGEPETANVLLATPTGERKLIGSLPNLIVTGISSVYSDQMADFSIYDLRGNKVLDKGMSTQRLPKGIYIIDGKKMVK